MKKVIFYLLENQTEADESGVLFYEKLACKKIVEAWHANQRVQVACQDQGQAERIDEYLWQLETDNFVPHNLAGEGMKGGSPVEISWPQKRSSGTRQLLINLQEQFPEFAGVYRDIIDFVPVDEQLKSLARKRYKLYKEAGFNLKTISINCE
ncbi:MAG: DNA polymerase III subunit chi [Gilliamella sp.]|uniref:DNA polymerase III subunit chi n=1 Tax=Gilliamella TaxID=1193503 RepID=UPI00080E10F4|nr:MULTISPECIES: DNA polymerase III subunit chi [Gilliamella]MCO6538189.1 DNA polymerase III subunit chi [Gilliamella sp.]MCO6540230.1 DNA polymerase III subunit chi [Gilliamella sp.]MCO6555277.1 DNA polymerase III subunit chi [Gilliamella sp.]NUE95295.1 DNA polymerase III subunit chi [Gilliamella sp. ESL0232]OCG75022.1 DNA polymerase III subunit chi [Gilliamella apicola]